MMKKVFEPSEIELADPRGDPNRVIAIQTKIKELLEANRQRKEGILEEIRDEGAWALPGLLNATYVWMNNFEKDKPAQQVMAELFAELAKENEAAIALLVDSGVLENPFKTPREIVLQALDRLEWKPSPEQVMKVNSQIQHQKASEDNEGLLLSYNLLARSGDSKTLGPILKQCTDWAAQKMDSGAALLGLLVKYYPESVEKILSDVFLATKHMYKEKNLANLLIGAIRPVPQEWWLDSTIIDMSIRVLKQCSPRRHTAIEYLWRDAAYDAQAGGKFWVKNSREVNTMLLDIVEQLDDDIAETISRYWFQALGAVADNLDIIIDGALSEHEPWGTSAAVQLFFMRGEQNKNRRNRGAAETALNRLLDQNESRYRRAEANFNTIRAGSKAAAETNTTSQASTLTDLEG
jgi:hypothetical protein